MKNSFLDTNAVRGTGYYQKENMAAEIRQEEDHNLVDGDSGSFIQESDLASVLSAHGGESEEGIQQNVHIDGRVSPSGVPQGW